MYNSKTSIMQVPVGVMITKDTGLELRDNTLEKKKRGIDLDTSTG